MDCPRCQGELRQARRLGVEIDFCPGCRGVWLDGGEMEKLLERSRGDDIYVGGESPFPGGSSGTGADSSRSHGKPSKKRGLLSEFLALFD